MNENISSIYFENTKLLPDMGFQIRFVTMKHNSPPHWHREMEILYILNGSAIITLGNERHHLKALDAMVIDSSEIHEVIYELPQTMGICIHISKSYMKRYLSDIELYHIVCNSKKLNKDQEKKYEKLCQYLKELTVLYFEQKLSYPFMSNAMILQILAVLVDNFCTTVTDDMKASNTDTLARLEQIFQFVEKNYIEQISLQDIADEFGLNKEYFCRFFKRNTGMTFLQYVNQVKLYHIYQDLLYTDGNIQEIMERHGMYNTKLFYKLFKKTYNCTPREIRLLSHENPYL